MSGYFPSSVQWTRHTRFSAITISLEFVHGGPKILGFQHSDRGGFTLRDDLHSWEQQALGVERRFHQVETFNSMQDSIVHAVLQIRK